MILKIEWVDPGERIFRILLSHSKRKPFEIWFREEKVGLEDYANFDNGPYQEKRSWGGFSNRHRSRINLRSRHYPHVHPSKQSLFHPIHRVASAARNVDDGKNA